MGFILSILALFLFSAVYLIADFVMMFVNVKNRKWYKVTARRKFGKAFKIDVFGNWLLADFWNLVFSKSGYKFGRFGETLSSCFGRKRLEKSLTVFGFCVSVIIDVVDFTKWLKKGHCIASIMNENDINNFIIFKE